MQPVPVIAASSSCPFATAAARSPSETWSTGPVTDATTPSVRRRLARELGRIAAAADGLDPAHLGLDADERRDLAGVPAQHGDVDGVEDPLRGVRPVGGRAGADRVEHDRDPPLVRRRAGEQHRLDPVLGERADVEHERARQADHLAHLVLRVRHHRQRAEREDRVRGLVHDHVVGDVVDERPALADRRRASRRDRCSCSSFQVEDVDRAVAGADLDEAVPDRGGGGAEAPRAASTSGRPRASSAASVAECVQPAPCVAATA